jgi:hypothetical protein
VTFDETANTRDVSACAMAVAFDAHDASRESSAVPVMPR